MPEQIAFLNAQVNYLDSAFFWESKLDVNVDGCPKAYRQGDTGLDFLDNAGSPGNWWGITCDKDGEPYIQGENDPAPGYYVSCTALMDSRFLESDPRRFIDSAKVPFIVLPSIQAIRETGVRLGDYAVVYYRQTQKLVFAIYADNGPLGKIGEGSIALHRALGHDPIYQGRANNGIDDGVCTVVFPRSHHTRWRSDESLEALNAEAQKCFESWGGIAKFKQCFSGIEISGYTPNKEPLKADTAQVSAQLGPISLGGTLVITAPANPAHSKYSQGTYLKHQKVAATQLLQTNPEELAWVSTGQSFELVKSAPIENHFWIVLKVPIRGKTTWFVYGKDHSKIVPSPVTTTSTVPVAIPPTHFPNPTNAEIQQALIKLGLLDPPADGKWGAQSKGALIDFQKHFQLPADGQLTQDTIQTLLLAKPFLKLGNDLASRIVKYMQARGDIVSMGDRRFNVVYLEGVNPDTGTPNDDTPNEFCDARYILEVPFSGIPHILGAWQGTVKAGVHYVDNPISEKPAARVDRKQFQSWRVGIHNEERPSAHEALTQAASITVMRYRNRHDYFNEVNGMPDEGDFGINQHWGFDYDYNDIEFASAGCLVGRMKEGHRNFMRYVKRDRRYEINNEYIFYTSIILGRDLSAKFPPAG